MKQVTNQVLYTALLIVALFASCNRGKTFTVEGNIKSADGDTLYFEHRDLAGVILLDSTILNKEGSFKFKESAPLNPEFYQLRIGDQIAAFSVDSTETVSVNADADNFYHSFTVKDSYTNNQLRRVDGLRLEAIQRIASLEEQHEANEIDDLSYLNKLDSVLIDYKSEISNVILGNPSSAAAYYAVFQQINNYLIFDPYDRRDYAMFGAVATSWSKDYPGTERTTHLYDFTVNAFQTRRQEEQQALMLENIAVETESGLPDISLPGVNGENIALSSLKGKVVLLDFVVYDADFSPKHNMDLNVLYNSYSPYDFEIYQISFDSDEHFWKTSADNLPWITVRDPRSVNTPILSTYNVREIPSAFIINREGDIVARVEEYSKLSELLSRVL